MGYFTCVIALWHQAQRTEPAQGNRRLSPRGNSTKHRERRPFTASVRLRSNLALGVSLALAPKAAAFVPRPPQARMALTPHLGHSQQQTRMSAASASTTEQTKPKRAAIVGGGPTGALMALYLSQHRGLEVDVFEAMHESKISGPTMRSWNIVLFDRATSALKGGGVDIKEEAGDLVIALKGSYRHHQKKNNNFFLGADSICRGDLAKTLLEKARKRPNVNVHFGCSFTNVDIDNRVATFERASGGSVDCDYDMLVGADGTNSRVRGALEENVPDFTVRQEKDPMAFKTILIPIMDMDEAEETWKSFFHVINSKIGCLIAPPRSDGMLTATVILPGEGSNTFEALMKTTQDVRDFFATYYPTSFGPEGPSEEVAKDFLDRRPQHLKSTYCSRLVHEDIVLLGDAAHSMWASLGQGVNSALEDCKVLAEVLDSAKSKKSPSESVDVQAVLAEYNERRFGDAIAACSLSEIGMGGARSMRPAFAAQLALTALLNKTLGRFAPETFGPPSLMQINDKGTPYASVLRGVKREARMLKGFCLAGVIPLLAIGARKIVLRI